MSEAVQEILRAAIDTNPHTTPLAGIDTDYPQQYHTVRSQDVLWGALVQISRWPPLADHLALF